VSSTDHPFRLDDWLQQLAAVEDSFHDSPLAIYEPTQAQAQLLYTLCRAYWSATSQECDQIRTALSDRRGVRNQLLGCVYQAMQHLQSPADRDWLHIGLAAAVIENCSFDYRDFFLALAELFVTAERVGLDPQAEFNLAAERASTSAPRGGTTPVHDVLLDFHTYAVVASARRSHT
jgi:hypothetical protein